ncbi:6,7-dimethyl-8-ribityllumazine synthase [Pseudodesulfovibrio sp.]|uniref:6,7-dimethyl-8-ribityllumazine synthase n=1 Tax=Pseudodesulfovibrio sp. TaxID=2035812 RepID=UPI00261DF6A3|nr:6,7-dimethyl-8-ribityllumazine synthase [Pseudodesulfovibrio sp.]MDD3311732.1 6,7-dimethyl-8-ribityllumazine synthase [Pseudodesulfovibrio sp.]
MPVKTIEGQLNAKGIKVALVAARFNDFIVDRLISGAIDYLVRHGASEEDLTLVRLPGAFELPIAAQKLARSGNYDGVVVLGAVIRGATPHFDYVCSECAKGVAHATMETGVPMGFGLLTCDTLDQAIERAGSKGGNKGVEAASAMLETVRVLEQL